MNRCPRCGKEQNSPGLCHECFEADLQETIRKRKQECLTDGEFYWQDFYDLLEDKMSNIKHMVALAYKDDDFPEAFCDVMSILIDDLMNSMQEELDFTRIHLGKAQILKARRGNSHHLEFGERLNLEFELTDEALEELKTSRLLSCEGSESDRQQHA